jgi:hypothetical protein
MAHDRAQDWAIKLALMLSLGKYQVNHFVNPKVNTEPNNPELPIKRYREETWIKYLEVWFELRSGTYL